MKVRHGSLFPGPHPTGHVVFIAACEVGGKDARPQVADLQDVLWQVQMEPRRFYD